MRKLLETKNPKQGEIYLLDMKFHDSEESKLRPTVVISNERSTDIDVIVINVSSAKPRNEFDVVIEYWSEAGLLKPSVARTTKIISISKEQLQNKIGSLHAEDLNRVISKFREIV